MTEENTRTSALAEKHKILGSGLEDWNGMGTAWTYNTDPNKEHDAIRESAGMIDMSGLKKIRISGKDALDVLNYSFSRELSNLQVGNSSYGIVLNDKGLVADDAIVYVNENEFIFPKQVSINVRSSENFEATLDYSKIVFNEKQKLFFKIPSSYAEVE